MQSPPPPPDSSSSAQEALEAAEAKLEALNEVGAAPKSWGDLGNPQAPPTQVEVPAFLSWLPGVLGGGAFITLLLNQFGVFGSGPTVEELNEFAERLSNM